MVNPCFLIFTKIRSQNFFFIKNIIIWRCKIINITELDDFYSETLEEMFYLVADKTLTKMMTEMLNTMVDMSPDIALERMQEISESALEKAWDSILGKKKTPVMSKEELIALAEKEKRTPRILTKEEFFALGDEKTSQDYSFDAFPERAERSKLYELGYSVSQDFGLSDRYRRDLLESIIRSGQMTKGQVANHLHYLIKINGKKGANDIALAKWKRDLEFVRTL